MIIMSIVKWDPFKDLLSFPREVDRFLEKTLGEPYETLWRRGTWMPEIDVYETEENVTVKAELPGLDTKDVDITVDEDALTIKGERKFSDEVKRENYHRVERRYGMFERTVLLPAAIKKEQVKAVFKDGVLEVVLPKVEKTLPKRVKVEIESK